MYFIYEEIDPRTNVSSYVGISNNPNARHRQHILDITRESAKSIWIAELLALGLEPKMRIIEIVDTEEEARIREKHWIRTYESQGIHLTNGTHSHNERKSRERGASLLYIDTVEKEWRYLQAVGQRDYPHFTEDLLLHIFVAASTLNSTATEDEQRFLKDWARKKWQEIEHDPDEVSPFLEEEKACG